MYDRYKQPSLFVSVMAILFFILLTPGCSTRHLQSMNTLSIQVDETLESFERTIIGGDTFLEKSEGVLVFPSVIKAGVGFGGEYGEGILRVEGRTADYYSTAGASFGFQFGAQRKSIVFVFLDKAALWSFQHSDGWKAGVDGSITIADWGIGEDINTIEIHSPVVAFAFDDEGFMYNLTLEGTKFTRLRH
ncbi:YSC84-related protein [Desulfosediminicola flagellatus]|uniref:lipid-binding SYLF domain-containing protein n=1 Tax=Desulfosediminicola flagellatus TaxID=2569541 RepID=UPI001C3D0BFE|nr:YSC84-related protein [Desulfosediminicola flagellatus]